MLCRMDPARQVKEIWKTIIFPRRGRERHGKHEIVHEKILRDNRLTWGEAKS